MWFQLHKTPSTSSLPLRDNLIASPLPPSSRTSSFRDDSSNLNASRAAISYPEQSEELGLPEDVEMDDEYLLAMTPYRPLDAPTPTSNSLSSPPSRQASQDASYLPLAGPFSSRNRSPDIPSSPSELSRRMGDSSSHASARSSPPVLGTHNSSIQQPEHVDPEPRPGPEDAEGSTRRWAFRSRKANQLQPYRFDRLQYKQQLRGNPDAVVTALSPHRRRSSPGTTMDQEFIADDDEENTQETGELPGFSLTGEEDSESQARDSRNPRRRAAPPTVGSPAQPPPQWYLDGMEQLSDTDSDEDKVVGYLADRSRTNKLAAEANNNGKTPAVSRKQSPRTP